MNKKIFIKKSSYNRKYWFQRILAEFVDDDSGAKVLGISNGFPTNPSNFKDLNLSKYINFKKIDVRNSKKNSKRNFKI